jgi:hypothetical protein
MAKVVIKKNMGAKYLVAMAGHDRTLGEIECIVTVPSSTKLTRAVAARHKSVLARTALLAEEFSWAIQDALVSRMKSDAA